MADLFDDRPKILRSIQELAQHYSKSPRTIRRWIRGGLPRLSNGTFDRGQVDAWLENQDKPAVSPPEVQGKAYWTERELRAKTEIRELELKQRRGELVEVAEVQQLFVARIMGVKQGLLGLARALPPQLIHCQAEREMEAVIGRAVRELLESYARPLPSNMRLMAEREVFMSVASEYFEKTYRHPKEEDPKYDSATAGSPPSA